MGIRFLPQKVIGRQCKGALQVMYKDSLDSLHTVFFLTGIAKGEERRSPLALTEVFMSLLFPCSVVV